MKYDVSYLKPGVERKGQERNHWVKIGVAFLNENETISLKLDALPLPDYWDYELRLFPKGD